MRWLLFGGFPLILGIAMGGSLVAGFDFFMDKATPYIDRAEAVRIGLDVARQDCIEIDHRPRAACRRFAADFLYESKDGWHMGLHAADRQSFTDLYVGRRGEID